tara:strand:+ start:1101 stop:1277 length:177 start_codon:yes stop_codon:yes gene_type:complete
MGLLKVIICLAVGLALERFIKKVADNHKGKPYMKYINPIISNRCYVILAGVLLVILLI